MRLFYHKIHNFSSLFNPLYKKSKKRQLIYIEYSGDYMRIIAQQTDALNTYDFWDNVINKDYIDSMGLNVALTKDDRVVTYNIYTNIDANINTIENSNLEELGNYELELFEDTLRSLSARGLKKDIYVNIAPFRTGQLTEENVKAISRRINLYIDKIKESIDRYPDLKVHLHTINRSIATVLKDKIKDHRIGFVISNRDLNFIDVNYYVMTMNAFNDTIIDLLLRENKEVILYVRSDYYISFIYDHYVGEKSTPHLQQVFKKLKIMTNYPEVINRVFN